MLLLDTHVFLWFINGDSKLPKTMMKAVETEKKVYVSIISFWELAIKNSLGKLTLPCSVSKLMADCEKMNMSILPVRAGHLEKLEQLPWIHRDPFDRLLICQAQAEGLKMVTADENIRQYEVEFIQ